MEKLRHVAHPPQDFSGFISRLLTDDAIRTLELWVTIKDHWSNANVTVRLWPEYHDGDGGVMVFNEVDTVVRLKEVYDDKGFPSMVFVIK